MLYDHPMSVVELCTESITLCFKNDLQQGGRGQTHSSYIPQIPVRGSLPQHADISTKHTPELHPPPTQTVVFQHQHTPRSPKFFINECRHHQVHNVRTSTCADTVQLRSPATSFTSFKSRLGLVNPIHNTECIAPSPHDCHFHSACLSLL